MSAIPKITRFCLPEPNKCSLKSQSPKIRKKLQKVSPNRDFRDPICLQFGHYSAQFCSPGRVHGINHCGRNHEKVLVFKSVLLFCKPYSKIY